MKNTNNTLLTRMVEANTLLCVGLDPDIRKLPAEILDQTGSDESKVYTFLTTVAELTAPHVCAYKVQKAFFDLLPGGHELLHAIITHIHRHNPQISVIIDCKIGDIGNTMEAYAENVFGYMNADGVVVNPYMGEDVIEAFTDYPDKAIVVLAKTSNSGGAVIQDIQLPNGLLLWEYVLNQIVGSWNKHNNMIPVLAATVGLNMQKYRSLIPDEMPILLAGVGAQGGTIGHVRELLNRDNIGVFVNSSRGILYPSSETTGNWQDSITAAAIQLKEDLNQTRKDKGDE